MMRPTFACLAGLTLTALLAGCAGYSTSSMSPNHTGAMQAPIPPPASLCNAQAAQFVVGKNSTGTVMESARVRSGAQMARILRPDQAVTLEFNAQRLNLQVDATGRIVAVRCG